MNLMSLYGIGLAYCLAYLRVLYHFEHFLIKILKQQTRTAPQRMDNLLNKIEYSCIKLNCYKRWQKNKRPAVNV